MSDVHAIVAEAVLPEGDTADRFGIEAEWFPLSRRSLARLPMTETAELIRTASALRERAGDNPSFVNSVGGTITYEPGGQIEHSGVAHPTIPGAFGELADTHKILTAVLEPSDILLVPAGVDHWNPVESVRQQLTGRRYPAMAEFFDARRSTGRLMMRHTASLQINLDAGGATLAERWVLANRLSPLLTAAFSTSPGTHVHSQRADIWRRLDPTRTGLIQADPDDDPVETLTRRALDADVVLVRRPSGVVVGAPGSSLAAWLARRHPEAGPLTAHDVRYHLTTLFPEVRLRKGVLELRAIDGLPGAWCVVPAQLAGGALYDETARSELLEATAAVDLEALWSAATRAGLDDERVARLSRDVWRTALEGAARLGTGTTGDLTAATDFVERRLTAGSTLADDIRTRLGRDARDTARWLAGA